MEPSFQSILDVLGRISANFLELRDGIQKAIQIAGLDPEMALTRARKVLELIVRDVFLRCCNEEPGTRPLENLLQRLVKDGCFPARLEAYATSVRKLGNVGTHAFGERVTTSDVYLSLTQLLPIIEWFLERDVPIPATAPSVELGQRASKSTPLEGWFSTDLEVPDGVKRASRSTPLEGWFSAEIKLPKEGKVHAQTTVDEPSWIDDWGRFIDPDHDCAWRLRGDKFTILVPGSEHDLGIARDLMNAPRVLRPIEGNFSLQVTVAGSFRPWDQAGLAYHPARSAYHPFHGAGLLLFESENSFVRLERATCWVAGEAYHYCNYETRSVNEIRMTSRQEASDRRLEDYLATRLRLRREGELISCAVAQGVGPWQEIFSGILPLPGRLQAGLSAVSTSVEAFAPVFYDLKLERGD